MNALVAREAKLKLALFGDVCRLFSAADTQARQSIGEQRRDLAATRKRPTAPPQQKQDLR